MKLPKPRKLKSGNWNVQIMFNGERLSHTAPTKKECDEWLILQSASNVNGFGVAPSKTAMTLRSAVDAYITDRSNVLSVSTIWKYKQIRDTHFQDYMDMKLSAIKNWQAVVNQEAVGYNPKTVKNAWSLIHASLKSIGIAVEGIRLPQLIEPDMPFLDFKQIEVFLKAVKGEDVEMAALLALHSLRRSELLPMTKAMAQNGILKVRGAMVTGEDNQLVYKKTNKAAASRRDIPIMIPRLQTLIDAHEDGLLVTWGGTKIIDDLHEACRKSGLPEVGLHGLRHSFASLCYHLGLNERQTMRLGGWGDPTVLRKIYTHLALDDNKAAEDKIRKFFDKMGS